MAILYSTITELELKSVPVHLSVLLSGSNGYRDTSKDIVSAYLCNVSSGNTAVVIPTMTLPGTPSNDLRWSYFLMDTTDIPAIVGNSNDYLMIADNYTAEGVQLEEPVAHARVSMAVTGYITISGAPHVILRRKHRPSTYTPDPFAQGAWEPESLYLPVTHIPLTSGSVTIHQNVTRVYKPEAHDLLPVNIPAVSHDHTKVTLTTLEYDLSGGKINVNAWLPKLGHIPESLRIQFQLDDNTVPGIRIANEEPVRLVGVYLRDINTNLGITAALFIEIAKSCGPMVEGSVVIAYIIDDRNSSTTGTILYSSMMTVSNPAVDPVLVPASDLDIHNNIVGSEFKNIPGAIINRPYAITFVPGKPYSYRMAVPVTHSDTTFNNGNVYIKAPNIMYVPMGIFHGVPSSTSTMVLFFGGIFGTPTLTATELASITEFHLVSRASIDTAYENLPSATPNSILLHVRGDNSWTAHIARLNTHNKLRWEVLQTATFWVYSNFPSGVGLSNTVINRINNYYNDLAVDAVITHSPSDYFTPTGDTLINDADISHSTNAGFYDGNRTLIMSALHEDESSITLDYDVSAEPEKEINFYFNLDVISYPEGSGLRQTEIQFVFSPDYTASTYTNRIRPNMHPLLNNMVGDVLFHVQFKRDASGTIITSLKIDGSTVVSYSSSLFQWTDVGTVKIVNKVWGLSLQSTATLGSFGYLQGGTGDPIGEGKVALVETETPGDYIGYSAQPYGGGSTYRNSTKIRLIIPMSIILDNANALGHKVFELSNFNGMAIVTGFLNITRTSPPVVPTNLAPDSGRFQCQILSGNVISFYYYYKTATSSLLGSSIGFTEVSQSSIGNHVPQVTAIASTPFAPISGCFNAEVIYADSATGDFTSPVDYNKVVIWHDSSQPAAKPAVSFIFPSMYLSGVTTDEVLLSVSDVTYSSAILGLQHVMFLTDPGAVIGDVPHFDENTCVLLVSGRVGAKLYLPNSTNSTYQLHMDGAVDMGSGAPTLVRGTVTPMAVGQTLEACLDDVYLTSHRLLLDMRSTVPNTLLGDRVYVESTLSFSVVKVYMPNAWISLDDDDVSVVSFPINPLTVGSPGFLITHAPFVNMHPNDGHTDTTPPEGSYTLDITRYDNSTTTVKVSVSYWNDGVKIDLTEDVTLTVEGSKSLPVPLSTSSLPAASSWIEHTSPIRAFDMINSTTVALNQQVHTGSRNDFVYWDDTSIPGELLVVLRSGHVFPRNFDFYDVWSIDLTAHAFIQDVDLQDYACLYSKGTSGNVLLPSQNDYMDGNMIFVRNAFDDISLSYLNGNTLENVPMTYKGKVFFGYETQIPPANLVGYPCSILDTNGIWYGGTRRADVVNSTLATTNKVLFDVDRDINRLTVTLNKGWLTAVAADHEAIEVIFDNLPDRVMLLVDTVLGVLMDPTKPSNALDNSTLFNGGQPSIYTNGPTEVVLSNTPQGTLRLGIVEVDEDGEIYATSIDSTSITTVSPTGAFILQQPVSETMMVFSKHTTDQGALKVERVDDITDSSLALYPDTILVETVGVIPAWTGIKIAYPLSIHNSLSHGQTAHGNLFIPRADFLPYIDLLLSSTSVCVRDTPLPIDSTTILTNDWIEGSIIFSRLSSGTVRIHLKSGTWIHIGDYEVGMLVRDSEVATSSISYPPCHEYHTPAPCKRDLIPDEASLVPLGINDLTQGNVSPGSEVQVITPNTVRLFNRSGMAENGNLVTSNIYTGFTLSEEIDNDLYDFKFTRSPIGNTSYDTLPDIEGPTRLLVCFTNGSTFDFSGDIPVGTTGNEITYVYLPLRDTPAPSVTSTDGSGVDMLTVGDLSDLTFDINDPSRVVSGSQNITLRLFNNNGRMAVWIYEDNLLKFTTVESGDLPWFKMGAVCLHLHSRSPGLFSERIADISMSVGGLKFDCLPAGTVPTDVGCESGHDTNTQVINTVPLANTWTKVYETLPETTLGYIHLDIVNVSNGERIIDVRKSPNSSIASATPLRTSKPVAPDKRMEIHNFRIASGETLWVRTSDIGVQVRVSSIEEI